MTQRKAISKQKLPKKNKFTRYHGYFQTDDHPKGEADVERTDSGVGGDLGQSHLRRSWEEIVMKSSEQWSVVAASARHWQELARRRKAEKSDTPTPKKKSSSHSLTEDMVCFISTGKPPLSQQIRFRRKSEKILAVIWTI